MQIPKVFASSVDPEKISLTIKGVIIAAVPVVIAIAGLTRLNLGQADISALADGLIGAIDLMAKTAAALMIVFGLVRKILVGIGVIKVS